jgi:hypothetical protein
MRASKYWLVIALAVSAIAISFPAMAEVDSRREAEAVRVAQRNAFFGQIVAHNAAMRAAIRECDYDKWVAHEAARHRAATGYLQAGGGFTSIPPQPSYPFPCLPQAAAPRFDPSRNHVVIHIEGGAALKRTNLHIDPGAFVPVNETFRSTRGFFALGAELMRFDQLVPFSLLPAGPLPPEITGFTFGIKGRGYFGDGASKSFSNGAISGDVHHTTNWSATGYVGFPQIFQQPVPNVPVLIVTPTLGITYQEDTLKSFQSFNFGVGTIDNSFEKTFGRVGATMGVNFDIPAGNFSYGLTTGVTILPSTTVHGTSSLGLPAQAKIDSAINMFIGVRAGMKVSGERVGNEFFF